MPKTKNRYKDKEKYREYANRNRKACYHRGVFYEDGGTKRHVFTLSEMNDILEHKISDRELAKRLKCSVQSIQNKRCRLKKGKKNESSERMPNKVQRDYSNGEEIEREWS